MTHSSTVLYCVCWLRSLPPGSITDELRQQLAPLESQGLVTVTPFAEILQYEVWAEGQVRRRSMSQPTSCQVRWLQAHQGHTRDSMGWGPEECLGQCCLGYPSYSLVSSVMPPPLLAIHSLSPPLVQLLCMQQGHCLYRTQTTLFLFLLWAPGVPPVQFVSMHDCLYRTRETARWVAFHDFDEYLEVPPPSTLPAILAENADKPFITHGCYNYNVDLCEGETAWGPKDGKYAVEMMLLRGKKPHCGGGGNQDPEWCLDGLGHRKFIYNPRMVRFSLYYITVLYCTAAAHGVSHVVYPSGAMGLGTARSRTCTQVYA